MSNQMHDGKSKLNEKAEKRLSWLIDQTSGWFHQATNCSGHRLKHRTARPHYTLPVFAHSSLYSQGQLWNMITLLFSSVYNYYTKKMMNSYTEFILTLKARTGQRWIFKMLGGPCKVQFNLFVNAYLF